MVGPSICCRWYENGARLSPCFRPDKGLLVYECMNALVSIPPPPSPIPVFLFLLSYAATGLVLECPSTLSRFASVGRESGVRETSPSSPISSALGMYIVKTRPIAMAANKTEPTMYGLRQARERPCLTGFLPIIAVMGTEEPRTKTQRLNSGRNEGLLIARAPSLSPRRAPWEHFRYLGNASPPLQLRAAQPVAPMLSGPQQKYHVSSPHTEYSVVQNHRRRFSFF